MFLSGTLFTPIELRFTTNIVSTAGRDIRKERKNFGSYSSSRLWVFVAEMSS